MPTVTKPFCARVATAAWLIASANGTLAQTPPVFDPYVAARMTWTNNARLNNAVEKKSDVILEVRPGIMIQSIGSRLKLLGNVEFTGVKYVDRTQVDRLLPRGNLATTLLVVDRVFLIDASLDAHQTAENPFAVQSLGTTTVNQFTTVQTRITPTLQSRLGDDARWVVRNDNSWTRSFGQQEVTLPDGYYSRNTAQIERDPIPFGARLEAKHDESRFARGTNGLVRDEARAIVDYALTRELTLGARGGLEHDRFPLFSDRGYLWGVDVSWRPNQRTDVGGYWERHYFGGVWDAHARHRMPWFAIDVQSSQQLSTYLQRAFELQTGGNVVNLVDAALTTRIPDPIERARAVRLLLDREGLSDGFRSPSDIVSQQVEIVRTTAASLVFLGTRNTAALGIFIRRTEPARVARNVPALSALTDNDQSGFNTTVGHRLSQFLALSATWTHSRTVGLGAFDTVRSKQDSWQLQLARKLAPRTDGVVGVRHQRQRTEGRADLDETAAFVGVLHHF